MDIRNFITFNSVVIQNSFTKAANHLNYAQSTVTLHIKELEKHYNEKLFDRIGKKIYLTPFGEKLYKKTKQLEYDYTDILSLSNEIPSTTLRIGGYESVLKYRLYDFIKSFKFNYPNVNIIIQYGTCSELRQMVKDGLLDMSFQLEDNIDFPQLVSIPLVKEDFSLILPPNSTLDSIHNRNQTVYLTEKVCPYRRMFEEYLDDNKINPQSIMETSSVDLIKQYVSFGLGFSLLPNITVRKKEEETRLTIVPFHNKTILLTQLVYHKDKHIFPAMSQFISMVTEHSKYWE